VKALPDQKLWKKYNLIAGVDEAGRGPLAGPVVAAAVILPKDFLHPEIDETITRYAIAYSFGIVEANTIDATNILQATKSAMYTAITSLDPPPQFVLIDALAVDSLPFKQFALTKGDTLSISIAAASILAKVRRDSMMREYHKFYPQYHFHRHKGYPTKLHRDCLRKYGSCPIHRKSFRLL
jgi:ribonuclease HII